MPSRRPAAVSALVLTALLAGCASSGSSESTDGLTNAGATEARVSAATGMLNDACPVTGRAVNPDARTAAWQDGTVGFCCNGCAARWDEMGDVDRAAKLASLDG